MIIVRNLIHQFAKTYLFRKSDRPVEKGEQFFIWGTLFLFVFDFNAYDWSYLVQNHSCWFHWKSCQQMSFFASHPASHALGIFQMLLLALIVLTTFFLIKRDWNRILVFLSLLTLFKFFLNFVWFWRGQHNFEYFHLLPTIAFLIGGAHRIRSAQVMWALCYFLSAFVKFSDGWIVGTYFSSLQMGMPLVMNSAIPVFTNLVIFAEIFLGFALLHGRYRKFAFLFWIVFHLYSTIMVDFYYPVRCLIMLCSLFYFELENKKNIFGSISYPAISLFLATISLQSLPILFKENPQMTLRTEGYGFSMIDANYQCLMTIKNRDAKDRVVHDTKSRSARGRCGARRAWLSLQNQCRQYPQANLAVELELSLNGGPFRKVISGENACAWDFPFWGELSWFDAEGPVVGYPSPNGINDNRRGTMKYDVERISKTSLQSWLERNLNVLKKIYFLIWCMTLYIFLIYLVRGRRE